MWLKWIKFILSPFESYVENILFKVMFYFIYPESILLPITLVIKSWFSICFIEIISVGNLPGGIVKNYNN